MQLAVVLITEFSREFLDVEISHERNLRLHSPEVASGYLHKLKSMSIARRLSVCLLTSLRKKETKNYRSCLYENFNRDVLSGKEVQLNFEIHPRPDAEHPKTESFTSRIAPRHCLLFATSTSRCRHVACSGLELFIALTSLYKLVPEISINSPSHNIQVLSVPSGYDRIMIP